MKKISVIVPCYNEEKSVHTMHHIITELFQTELSRFDYELIFVDDYSRDNTRNEIKKICESDKKVKAVLNVKNFGFTRNVFSSFLESTGDATFMVFGDLQDPPQLLPKFIEQWEKGYKVIVGQKTRSRESKLWYFLRTIYYNIVALSEVPQIPQYNGFGLYDKEFIDILRQIEDPQPYLKGIVGEFAMDLFILEYTQEATTRGFSNFNFASAYDSAMLGITSYTKIFMRIATFIGAIIGGLSLCFAAGIFIAKVLNLTNYPVGVAGITVGLFFFSAVQLFFIGILGEYILSINMRILKRPLTIAKRINFE